jgi:hypothetical protein
MNPESPLILGQKLLNSDTMKNPRHIAKNDSVDNRLEISNHKVTVPRSKLISGELTDKYPVILDDGRTIVYIADKSREREIRLRYGLKQG